MSVDCESVVQRRESAIIATITLQEEPIDPLNPDIPPPGEGWRKHGSHFKFPPRVEDRLLAAIKLLADGRKDVGEILDPPGFVVWQRQVDPTKPLDAQ